MPLFKKRQDPSSELRAAVDKVNAIASGFFKVFNSAVDEFGLIEETRDKLLNDEIPALKEEKRLLKNDVHEIHKEADKIQQDTVKLYNSKIDDLNDREQNFIANTEKKTKELDRREAGIADAEQQKALAVKAIDEYSKKSLALDEREQEIVRREQSVEAQKDEWDKIAEAKQLFELDQEDLAKREAICDRKVEELMEEAGRLVGLAKVLGVRSNLL